jgi:antitoxin (DNA-binding transcriptional repressor) of toxin-antitoxin stability system
MTTISIEEAQAKLPELIEQLSPGEELLIVRNQRPVAKLVGEAAASRRPRKPGSAKNVILSMSEDFDAPLEDFKDYME